MSWETKTDYCGLENANTLKCKGSNMNAGGEYLEKAGQSGAICATKPYGANGSPSCEYSILKPGTLTGVKLGAVTTVDGKRYALESFTYSTGADEEPSFSAQARLIETTSDTTQRTFDVPALDISPDEAAAMAWSAATLGGNGCELVKCEAVAESSVKVHTVNSTPVASDCTKGRLRVSLTILQTSTTAPTVTPGTDWDMSSPLTCDDLDADMPTWTCALSKPLAYTTNSNS